jgi:hypothetical protein
MTADLEELERARRFLAIDWADVARRRANKRRLAVGPTTAATIHHARSRFDIAPGSPFRPTARRYRTGSQRTDKPQVVKPVFTRDGIWRTDPSAGMPLAASCRSPR